MHLPQLRSDRFKKIDKILSEGRWVTQILRATIIQASASIKIRCNVDNAVDKALFLNFVKVD